MEEEEVLEVQAPNVGRKSAKSSRAKSGRSNSRKRPAPTSKKAAKGGNVLGGPLEGLTVVITGELHCVSDRKELQEVIKMLGGSATGSVSGKTTHLIAGHILTDGRGVEQSSKYKKAQDKGVTIFTEDALDEFLKQSKNITLSPFISSILLSLETGYSLEKLVEPGFATEAAQNFLKSNGNISNNFDQASH